MFIGSEFPSQMKKLLSRDAAWLDQGHTAFLSLNGHESRASLSSAGYAKSAPKMPSTPFPPTQPSTPTQSQTWKGHREYPLSHQCLGHSTSLHHTHPHQTPLQTHRPSKRCLKKPTEHRIFLLFCIQGSVMGEVSR